MCLLVLAWNAHPRYRLIVAANRDELHERPAAPLAFWEPRREILGGRDLKAGGAWLAIDRERRFAVITNFRDLQRPSPGAPTRGQLIPDYLGGGYSAGQFAQQLSADAARYSGFNLLLADRDSLWYAANRTVPSARSLAPGVHGLSNELLDSPWPKLVRVREKFESWLKKTDCTQGGELFDFLNDREPTSANTRGEEALLPPDLARALTAPFVLNPRYGTRCSTVVLLEHTGALAVIERRFDSQGAPAGETSFARAAGEWT